MHRSQFFVCSIASPTGRANFFEGTLAQDSPQRYCQVVFAGFTALVGAFANGGDVWQRLLVVLLHPLGAAGLLLLVLRPRLATTKILAMMALLTANVLADLWVAQMIAAGRVRGDWELALAFSVVPAIGIAYAFALLRTAR